MGHKNPASRFRELLSQGGCTPIPGVFSPSVALLARRAGFDTLYLSGSAFSGMLGLPDIGLTTMTEVAGAAEQITERVDLPLLVDIDTGFGEAANVARTVSRMERANVAGVQIEDQVMPKRCGHLEGKQLIEAEEMVKKIIAARDASTNEIVIVARTDAASVDGMDAAVERARLYLRAGADVIFPEALRNEGEFREFSRKVKAPLLANMTEFGKTDYISVKQFERLGYRGVLFPVTTFRIMMKAVEEALGELAKKGTQKGFLDRMMERRAFYDLIGYDAYGEVDSRTAAEARRVLDTN